VNVRLSAVRKLIGEALRNGIIGAEVDSFLKIPVLGLSCPDRLLRGTRSLRDVCTGLAG
jgi:hypothetical protein